MSLQALELKQITYPLCTYFLLEIITLFATYCTYKVLRIAFIM